MDQLEKESKQMMPRLLASLAHCQKIKVYGEAMLPKYEPGDTIFVQYLSEGQIEYGVDYYIVLSNENKLIRTIRKSEQSGKVILRSCNPAECIPGHKTYADIVIDRAMIACLFTIEGQIRRFC